MTEGPCKNCYTQIGLPNYTKADPAGDRPQTIYVDLAGAKYDSNKPQLSLICCEFVRILLRNHPDRKAADAYLAIKKLSQPDVATEENFSHSLFSAIDALSAIRGPRALMNECAIAMRYAADTKYTRNNWRLGLDAMRLLDAAERHMSAYLSGESVDAETGSAHYGNAAFCLQCIAEYMREPGKPHLQRLFNASKKENWPCKAQTTT